MRKESDNRLIINPPVFAHRGASAYAPENTLAAFLKAKQLGAAWVEFDVMLSADRQVVVIHDETLDRTTSGTGDVFAQPYAYLKSLDAGSWFGSQFSSQKIPLLNDVIDFLHAQKMSANVEIKALPGSEAVTVQCVLHEIQQHWSDEMIPPLVSSFSLDILYLLRQQGYAGWLGLLLHEWRDDWRVISDELQCISIHLNEKIVDQAKITLLKKSGLFVFCYTVNSMERAQELFSWGVDAIYSDYPDVL